MVESRTDDGFVLRLPEPLPVPTPTVHQGHILVGAGLWYGAIAPRRGDVVWATQPGDINPTSAACEGNLCAFNTYSCTVVVVEADSGHLRTSKWLGPTVLSAPAIADGTVYASFTSARHRISDTGDIANGGLVALDLETGGLRWRHWLDRDVVGAPVVGGDGVHVSTWGGTLMSFGRDTGELRGAQTHFALGRPTWHRDRLHLARLQREAQTWRVDLLGLPAPTPVGEGPPAPYWHLASIPAVRGLAQRRRLYPGYDRDAVFPPAAADWPAPSDASRAEIGHPYGQDHIYGGVSPVHAGTTTAVVLGDQLVAVRDGRVTWTRDLSDTYERAAIAPYFTHERWDPRRAYGMRALHGYPPATLSAAPERVVATTLDGRALILDATSGQLQQTIELGHPVVNEAVLDDGWLYVGTLDGRLVAVNTADPAIDGWSTYGGNAHRDGHPRI